MNTQYLIDVWLALEDKQDKVSITLYNMNNETLYVKKISLSNDNLMKYLDVYVNDNKDVYQSFTHIHSFVNEMISMYGNNIFSNFFIKYNECLIKRKHNDDTGNNDNYIKKMRCE
jgi:hypothetical protein